MQGIAWNSLPGSRETFRISRVNNYQNYRNLDLPFSLIQEEITPVQTGSRYFDFRYTRIRDRCTVSHFQLRNLLWATSKNDIYYPYRNAILHWCPIQRKSTKALDLEVTGMGFIKASTMSAGHNFIIVGGL